MRADTKDLVGGGLLAAIGVYVLITSTGYTVGTVRQMGPGYYPMLVSGLLIFLGLLILVLAFRRRGAIPMPEWGPLVAVLGSVLVFALCIRNLGLIPAVVACYMVCAAGHKGWGPARTATFAVLLSIASWLLFSKFLGLTMPALTWPVLIL